MQPSVAVKQYYDTRAPEYDEWYLGRGRFAHRERPGWQEEVAELERVVAALPPLRTLDVACGTGFLTRHLRGEITALDQSERMLAIAGERMPDATLVRGDALELPFDDDSFDRVFTGHFYGHLESANRTRFPCCTTAPGSWRCRRPRAAERARRLISVHSTEIPAP